MSYITHAEYEEITKNKEMKEEEFSRLLPLASDILDNETNNFYVFQSLEDDHLFRATKFKKALCAQITYFNDLGATTFEKINSSPQTFSAGRTSVSNASRYNSSGANESKPLVAEEVYMHLRGTGLLFSGVL